MKKISLLVVCAACFFAGATEIWLGGGVITQAALSQKMPKVANFDAANFPGLPERRAYAMVTIDVPSTRKISIFDYVVEMFGRDYCCVALREANGKWQTTDKTFPGGKKYSLLFILNGGMVGMRDQETVTLKNVGSQTETAVPLQNLRTSSF